MRGFLKKYGSVLYIAGMSAAVVLVISLNGDIGEILTAFTGLDPKWVAMGFGCMMLYYLIRATVILLYTRSHGQKLNIREALGVTGAGQFYSAITPSASGGQPAQIVRMVRHGVPIGVSTAAISVEFLGFQAGFLVLGALAWIFRHDVLASGIAGFGWLTVIGYVFNAGLIALIVLAVANLRALERFIAWALRLGNRLRLIRDPDGKRAKTMAMMEDYRIAMLSLLKAPIGTAVIAVLSVMETALYMLVPFCVYKAFGLYGVSCVDIAGMALMLFIASAFIPLPGAAGASESGFCLFFHGIFPEDCILAAMFCWRFLTYYLSLLLGFGVMAVDDIVGNLRSGKN